MHVVHDSILIYSAIPDEFSIKKYDLFNHREIDKIKIKTDDHKESFFYSDRGLVAANDSFIVYSYVFKKQIDIYNISDLKLKKRIIGKSQLEGIAVGDFENNIYQYISIIAKEKYFYALYQGNKAENNHDCIIEVYDYDGNPIIKYDFDIIPFLFEVDEKNRFIYGFNNNYENFLLIYKLN